MKHLLLLNMRKTFYILLFFISLPAAYAVEVTNLYSARVAVASQSIADRNVGLKQALKAVFIKVGGKEVKHPVFTQAIRNYNAFVNQYQLSRVKGQSYLTVSFNEDKIKQLFKESNSALWGSLRPQIVIWVVKEDGFERNILAETSDEIIANTIAQFSQLRGLPMVMPLMDLIDINAIDVTDVWGRFAQPINVASQRYAAEAVIIVRLSNSSLVAEPVDTNCQPLCQTPQLTLDWSLIADSDSQFSQTFSQPYSGDDVAGLFEQALTDITDIIYNQYALTTSNSKTLAIDVANVDGLATLIKVTDFLTALSAVESVQLIQVNGQNRRFKLSLLGNEQSLLSSLKLTGQLNQYIDPLAGPEEQAQVPVFYWEEK